jgi:predicted acylesterase/phospholipase RssA
MALSPLRTIYPLALSLVLLTGCTQRNVPLNAAEVPLEQHRQNHTLANRSGAVPNVVASPGPPQDRHNDGCFVGLALSGGGSRSANFSAACMFQLQRLGLLDRADYISSVSGGSLPAAYYCLNDSTNWNPANVQKKLTHSFASDVIWQVVLPWNSIALTFSDWDRSDLLADSFRRTLFSRDGRALTFADLRDDRPRLLINATDLQTGRSFVFCDESFDRINSDLSKYPIAHAVAASAAAPVVMHHVTLRDYSTTYKQFRHLIDGGINDNLGIATLVEAYESQVIAAQREGRANPYPNGAVLIILDARTQADARLDDKGDFGLIESLSTGASITTNALLNRVSSATLSDIIVRYSPDDVTAATLRGQIAELDRDGYLELRDRRGNRVVVVHLALSRVRELTDMPSRGFFQRLNDISTYFDITEAEAASLYKAAELLVRQKFEQRLRDVAEDLRELPTTREL